MSIGGSTEVEYVTESEQNDSNETESSGEYDEPSTSRRGRPRGIMAYRHMMSQRGAWTVEKQPTVPSCGSSGRGQSPSRARGRARGRSRGHGRGFHMERLQEHSQIVDSLVEEDMLFPSTEAHVRPVRKTAPILTKGIYIFISFFSIFMQTLILLNVFLYV